VVEPGSVVQSSFSTVAIALRAPVRFLRSRIIDEESMPPSRDEMIGKHKFMRAGALGRRTWPRQVGQFEAQATTRSIHTLRTGQRNLREGFVPDAAARRGAMPRGPAVKAILTLFFSGCRELRDFFCLFFFFSVRRDSVRHSFPEIPRPSVLGLKILPTRLNEYAQVGLFQPFGARRTASDSEAESTLANILRAKRIRCGLAAADK